MRIAAGGLLPLLVVAAAASGAAQEPAPGAAGAREALAALAAGEARLPRARLLLVVADRRATLAGPLDDAARAAVAAAPGATAEGSLAYGAEGWLKDLRVPAGPGVPRALRLRTAEAAGVLRNLMEATGADGAPEAHARVLRVPLTAPADAVLTRRSAAGLVGVEWTVAGREGDLLRLEGRRGKERHTITLARLPTTHVRRWVLLRRLTSPEGEEHEQRYECRVEVDAAGAPGRVEEWVCAAAGATSVTYRRTEVRAVEALPEGADLFLRFPAGTRVLDVRNEVPVEYEQTAEGINDADVNEAAKALAQGRTRVGQPAPDFFFADRQGKLLKLTDLTGNTVVLFWFATGSEPARAAGPALRELAEKYRRRRVRVLGLLVGEGGDVGAKAEAFRKEFRWGFPVYADTQGEALHRFGLISAVPKIAVIDPKGTLVHAEPGADLAALAAVLERVADKP